MGEDDCPAHLFRFCDLLLPPWKYLRVWLPDMKDDVCKISFMYARQKGRFTEDLPCASYLSYQIPVIKKTSLLKRTFVLRINDPKTDIFIIFPYLAFTHTSQLTHNQRFFKYSKLLKNNFLFKQSLVKDLLLVVTYFQIIAFLQVT